MDPTDNMFCSIIENKTAPTNIHTRFYTFGNLGGTFLRKCFRVYARFLHLLSFQHNHHEAVRKTKPSVQSTLCSWTLDFLTSRPQRVQICSHTSTLVLITRAMSRTLICAALCQSVSSLNIQSNHYLLHIRTTQNNFCCQWLTCPSSSVS